MTRKTVDYYMKLPYHIEVIRDDDKENPGYVARVTELTGCVTQGDTFEEVDEMIEDAMRTWIETALHEGIEIPSPMSEESFGGNMLRGRKG